MPEYTNLILNFSHVYEAEQLPDRTFNWLDCTDIVGDDMYCEATAAAQIRRRLRPYGPHGIHLLDSGNYHYVTLFFTEMLTEPYVLVLLDHHSDMQPALIPGLTSCGDWARQVLQTQPALRQLLLIGPEASDLADLPDELAAKLLTVSWQQLNSPAAGAAFARVAADVPCYISLDKDILSHRYARTNWSQGEMSEGLLEMVLAGFFTERKILGIDICGEAAVNLPWPEFTAAEALNGEENRRLVEFIRTLFK